MLSARETPLRNARRHDARAGQAVRQARPRQRGAGRVVGEGPLRRPAKVKGKLVAWACPATVSAGATPPPCSAKVTLRKSAKLRLPATLAGKVRVVVVRAKG